jgi:hypothetical protein
MEMRYRLGAITRWDSPVSKEAVILARAIEAAISILDPRIANSGIFETKFGLNIIIGHGFDAGQEARAGNSSRAWVDLHAKVSPTGTAYGKSILLS